MLAECQFGQRQFCDRFTKIKNVPARKRAGTTLARLRFVTSIERDMDVGGLLLEWSATQEGPL